MCVNPPPPLFFPEVEGKRQLRSDAKLRRLSVELEVDIGNQYMPGQRRNVTYLSRLQVCVAAHCLFV